MNEPKRVTLEWFAVLREIRRRDRETVSTVARTAAELYEDLAATHGFRLGTENVRVAINDEFAPWAQELREGDRVVFIPPVAGG